jgi:hypothetical protein
MKTLTAPEATAPLEEPTVSPVERDGVVLKVPLDSGTIVELHAGLDAACSGTTVGG